VCLFSLLEGEYLTFFVGFLCHFITLGLIFLSTAIETVKTGRDARPRTKEKSDVYFSFPDPIERYIRIEKFRRARSSVGLLLLRMRSYTTKVRALRGIAAIRNWMAAHETEITATTVAPLEFAQRGDKKRSQGEARRQPFPGKSDHGKL